MNSNEIAATAYPGSTLPMKPSARIATEFAVVSVDEIACWRLIVVAHDEAAASAKLRNAIPCAIGVATATGTAVAIGRTTAMTAQRTPEASVIARKPLMLSAPAA